FCSMVSCNMTDKGIVDSSGGSAATVKTPGNLIVVNPDEPSYDTLHLCIYMRELLDEAEKELEAAKREEG
ncbi:MAG: hypothetical protein WCQ90_02250, partial [Deltaproteobacteria bacterium]